MSAEAQFLMYVIKRDEQSSDSLFIASTYSSIYWPEWISQDFNREFSAVKNVEEHFKALLIIVLAERCHFYAIRMRSSEVIID